MKTLSGWLPCTKGIVHFYSYPRDRVLHMGRMYSELTTLLRVDSSSEDCEFVLDLPE
jgi:hypothetical protein